MTEVTPTPSDVTTQIDAFVREHVKQNITQLVIAFLGNPEATLNLFRKNAAKLNDVRIRKDYEAAAYRHGFRVSKDEGETGFRWQDGDEHSGGAASDQQFDTELDAWVDACASGGIAPDEEPVYEYYLVSDALGRKLLDRGEVVVVDFLGLWLWGRTGTGQAVSLDEVIVAVAQR